MEIITWSDPKYFVFAQGLIGSIRYHGNENNIIVYLLDFNQAQYEYVQKIYTNDSKILFKNLSSLDTKGFKVIDNKTHNPDVDNGKIQFYRNFRPRMFLEELKSSKTGKICTFGANGLVFTKLNYIENILDEKDFVFMEREKNNVFSKNPEKVSCIEDLVDIVRNNNIDIDKILPETTGKVVLLGTHAMSNTPATISVLERWIELIEKTDAINTKFSDMNLFVKSCVENILKGKDVITKETGLSLPRDKNPFCDTSLIDGNKIWFAKGPSKFNSSKYQKALEKFVNYKYTI